MTWTSDKIREELMALFRQHAQGGVEVGPESHIIADLGIDSLGVTEILADIEDKFHMHVPDEALAGFETIADVAASIEARLREEGRLSE
ncbi:MAG: phosphopantetheine-binding protein [Byssovorax sp.]